jgi:uroporphyrinogen decarboxylase
MYSRERVLAALSHEEPDRVPIDMGGTVSTIHFDAYRALLRHLNMNIDNIWILDSVSGSSRPDEKVLRKFQIDTRYIYPKLSKIEPNPPIEIIDIWGIKRRFTGYYYDLTKDGSPLFKVKDLEEIERLNWPNAKNMAYNLEDMIDQAEKLAKQDYAIGLPYVIVGSFAHSMLLRGYQQFLADIILRPKIADAIMEKVADIMVTVIEKYVKPIGNYLDFVFFGDDLGTQIAPIISPKVYREHVKPRHKKIVDAFKRATKAKVIIHSDGAISSLIDDLVDTGISGINPVQVTAKGMDSKELKDKFGDKIVFWGAIDTQRRLPFGTSSDVRKEVRLRIDQLGKGGGYILASVHNIQPLTPPENITAMFNEAIEYGDSPYKA